MGTEVTRMIVEALGLHKRTWGNLYHTLPGL